MTGNNAVDEEANWAKQKGDLTDKNGILYLLLYPQQKLVK
jgi:hypothetical protein